MAPAVCNSLSSVTKISATVTTFKAQIKTELFSAAYAYAMVYLTFLLPAAPPIRTLDFPVPPINVFDIDVHIAVETGLKSLN